MSQRTRHSQHATIFKKKIIVKRRKKTFDDNIFGLFVFSFLALKSGGAAGLPPPAPPSSRSLVHNDLISQM